MSLKSYAIPVSLLALVCGCAGAEFTEPPLQPPARGEEVEQGPGTGAPVATLKTPEAGGRYRGGSVITFEGRGMDAEDGALPATAFTWRVDFHQGGKASAFVPPLSGLTRASFTVPEVDEAAGPAWYRIHLEVRDSEGNRHAVFRDVHLEEGKAGAALPARVR